MANRNAPSGFQPVSYLNGADWNGAATRYYIPQEDLNAYYVGDLVESLAGASDGVVQGQISVGVARVTKCAAGATPRGAIVGIGTDIVDLSPSSIPATKLRSYFVYVADAPQLVFAVQCDNPTTLASTVVGQFADFSVAAPTVANAQSATVLDYLTIAANPALPLRILGLRRGDFTAYCQFLVALNLHELS